MHEESTIAIAEVWMHPNYPPIVGEERLDFWLPEYESWAPPDIAEDMKTPEARKHDKDRAADDALPSDRQQVLEEADGDRECSLSVTGKAETRESLSSHGSWNDMDVMRRVQSASPSSPLAMLRQRVPVNIGPDVLWSKLLKEAAWDVDLLPFLNSGTFNPDQVSNMACSSTQTLDPEP